MNYIFLFVLSLIVCHQVSYTQNTSVFTTNQAFGGNNLKEQNSQTQKVHVNLQLGSMFFSGNQIGSGFGTYIAPVISYPVHERFNLRFGSTIYQGFGHAVYRFEPAERTVEMQKHSISTATVFVSGSYDVNPRLTLFGTAYKQFDLNPPEHMMNPQAINFESEGFTAGFNLRISENMQINGLIDYSRGHNPYYYSPLNINTGRSFSSPFYW